MWAWPGWCRARWLGPALHQAVPLPAKREALLLPDAEKGTGDAVKPGDRVSPGVWPGLHPQAGQSRGSMGARQASSDYGKRPGKGEASASSTPQHLGPVGAMARLRFLHSPKLFRMLSKLLR